MPLRVLDSDADPEVGRHPARAVSLLPTEDDAHEHAPEPAEPEELNLRVLQPLLRYVRDKLGADRLNELVSGCRLPPGYLDREAPWVALDRFDAVLHAARGMMSSDAEFMEACAYDMRSGYGPMLLVLRALTVRMAYDIMARTSSMVSRVSRFEVAGGTRTSVVLRYTSQRREGRLLCLSRQAQQRAAPSVWWAMSPALLEERSCIAHGDPCCEYVIRWHEPLRLRLVVLGAIAAAAIAAVLSPLASPLVVWLMAPLLGASLGGAIQLWITLREYRRFSAETTGSTRKVVEAHARAVDELLGLHERVRTRNEELERQAEARAARLGALLERMESISEYRQVRLRSLTHDLRNPLTSLQMIPALLRAQGDTNVAEEIELIHESVEKMLALVDELGSLAREDGQGVQSPEPLDVGDLADRLRRQLRATVTGRDIRVSVFTTREAPPTIRAVKPLFERLVDNLLTNAAKYTDRGSIVVEVEGVPSMLVLKISDTGRGIGPERIEQVFLGGQADESPAIGVSRGFGLGIVVRLLDQLGGRLEIMSEPGVGTTLWVYVPVEAPPLQAPVDRPESLERVVDRVVKIRARPT